MSVAHIGRNDDSSVIKNPRRITDGDFCNFISKYVILVSSELSRRSGAGFHAAHQKTEIPDPAGNDLVTIADIYTRGEQLSV